MRDFDLLTELKEYKPFNKTEATYVADIIRFLEKGKDQFVRANFERHVVASAFVLNPTLDKALLTHHKALGVWLPLGGHSDGDKNSLNVALRECTEESEINGINVGNGKIIDVDIHTIPNNLKKNEPEHKHLEIRFIFTAPESQFIVSDESNALSWMPLDEFKKICGSYYSGSDRITNKIDAFVAQSRNQTKPNSANSNLIDK